MKKVARLTDLEVCGHVLVGSVYARTFRTGFTREEYLAAEFEKLQKSVFGKKRSSFLLQYYYAIAKRKM